MEQAVIHVSPELFAPAESSRFEGKLELDGFDAGPDAYEFAGPLSWQVDVTNTGEAILVMGSVECRARTACTRCLEPAEFALAGEIEGYYLLDDAEEGSEDADSDEFDVLPESNDIDLVPLIIAALLVEVPLVPLCDDDCKGLCPGCGANLNEGACACGPAAGVEVEGKPNPFAALKDYKFGE